MGPSVQKPCGQTGGRVLHSITWLLLQRQAVLFCEQWSYPRVGSCSSPRPSTTITVERLLRPGCSFSDDLFHLLTSRFACFSSFSSCRALTHLCSEPSCFPRWVSSPSLPPSPSPLPSLCLINFPWQQLWSRLMQNVKSESLRHGRTLRKHKTPCVKSLDSAGTGCWPLTGQRLIWALQTSGFHPHCRHSTLDGAKTDKKCFVLGFIFKEHDAGRSFVI